MRDPPPDGNTVSPGGLQAIVSPIGLIFGLPRVATPQR